MSEQAPKIPEAQAPKAPEALFFDEADFEQVSDKVRGKMRWVVNFVRHAMRPSELINPVAFVQMLPGRCTPVQLAAAACCKKFLYIQ